MKHDPLSAVEWDEVDMSGVGAEPTLRTLGQVVRDSILPPPLRMHRDQLEDYRALRREHERSKEEQRRRAAFGTWTAEMLELTETWQFHQHGVHPWRFDRRHPPLGTREAVQEEWVLTCRNIGVNPCFHTDSSLLPACRAAFIAGRLATSQIVCEDMAWTRGAEAHGLAPLLAEIEGRLTWISSRPAIIAAHAAASADGRVARA